MPERVLLLGCILDPLLHSNNSHLWMLLLLHVVYWECLPELGLGLLLMLLLMLLLLLLLMLLLMLLLLLVMIYVVDWGSILSWFDFKSWLANPLLLSLDLLLIHRLMHAHWPRANH